jgi:signal peptidase
MRAPRLRDTPLLLGLALFVAWFVLLRPTTLGGPASYLWVNGTSMVPTLASGDLAVVRESGVYAPGDIIGFRVPEGEPGAGALVIHRIVGGSASGGFVTQGDDKPIPDRWRPTGEDVVGSVWFVLPGAGPAVSWIRQPAVVGSLAAALVVFSIMAGGMRSGERPASTTPAAPTSAPYRWTRERGLAVCGVPGAGAPVDPYQWTLERGLAVCGAARPRLREAGLT